MMVSRMRKALVWALGGVMVACGGDDPAAPKKPAGFTAPASDAARDDLRSIPWHELSFEQAMARFDVNGDDVLDAKDLADLDACIDAGADLDGYRCDLVVDGVVDTTDRYALMIVLGEQSGRAVARIADAAQSLRDNAAGKWEPELGPNFFDWNGDGKLDASDVLALADVLESDLSLLDLDGSGFVSFADVVQLAELQAKATFSGGAAPPTDLNGDGASDGADLTLLADLALYTSDMSLGVLDTDGDGKVDEDDFCVVGAMQADASYYDLFMPKAAAGAAFGTAAPKLAFCRADGRAQGRLIPRLDTPHVLRLRPTNLYLEAVSAVPAGYAPTNPDDAEGRQLFVVTASPSTRPVLSLTVPWDATLAGGDAVGMRVGGDPLPADASLVLPGAIAPLTELGAKQLRRRSAPKSDLIAPLPPVIAAGFAPAVDKLNLELSLAKKHYQALIDGCPCTVPPADREELVRYLVRAKHCLETTLATVKAELAAAEIRQSRLMTMHVTASTISAAYYQLQSDSRIWIEVFATALLFLEATYDWGSGGPAKALANQTVNLIGNITAEKVDELLPSQTSNLEHTATSMGKALGDMPLSSALEAAFNKMLTNPGAPLSPKEFTKTMLDGVKGQFSQPNLAKGAAENMIKAVLKELPEYYKRYLTNEAARRSVLDEQYTREHREAMLEVARLRHAVQSIETASATLGDLRTAFLAKLQQDGCGMSISTADPCSFDLEAAIDAALSELAAADASTAAGLDGAKAAAGDAPLQSACTSGPQKQAVDRAAIDVIALRKEILTHQRGGGSASALAQLDARMAEAAKGWTDASDDLAIVCATLGGYDVSLDDISAVRAAEVARQKAFDDFRDKVKAALDAYEACLQGAGQSGGACGFDAALAVANPWAAAAKCLECHKVVGQNCCGDGKVQPNEQCDPGSVVTAVCSGVQQCTSSCTCETPSASCDTDPLTQSARTLGSLIGGFSTTAFCAPWVTSMPSTFKITFTAMGPKAVAHDHTTLYGAGAYSVGLTQAHLDALFGTGGSFPCGDGPNGRTLCSPYGTYPGQFLLLGAAFEAAIPMSDPSNLYQYGFVFDADGSVSNNYQPPAQYADDLFKNTDRWYEANYAPAGGWSLKVSTAASGNIQPAQSAARIVVSGNSMMLVVPADEFAVAKPGYRLTAFRHKGDYGANPPHDYDGSVWPLVNDPLAPWP